MSIIKHVTLQKIVAHDFRYDPLSHLIRQHSVVLTSVQFRALILRYALSAFSTVFLRNMTQYMHMYYVPKIYKMLLRQNFQHKRNQNLHFGDGTMLMWTMLPSMKPPQFYLSFIVDDIILKLVYNMFSQLFHGKCVL